MLLRAELTVSAEVAFSEPSLLSIPTTRNQQMVLTASVSLVLRVIQIQLPLDLVGKRMMLVATHLHNQLVSLSKRESGHSELSLDLEGGRISTMELICQRLTSGFTTLQTLTTQGLTKLNANNCANKPRLVSHMVGKMIFVG